MSSGDGLKKKDLNFTDPLKFRKEDLLLCVRFEDLYGFFLYSELYDDRYFNDTKLVYGKKEKMGKVVQEKLLSKNKMISVSSNRVSKKVPLYNIFQFDVFTEPKLFKNKIVKSGSFKNSYEMIFNYLNGVNQIPAKDPNGKDVKQSNFLSDPNIKKMNKQASTKQREIYIMRVLQSGFIIPQDIQNFSVDFMKMKKSSLNGLSLKVEDIPKLCSETLLVDILSREGRKEITGGYLCYTVIPYKDNTSALVPNIVISDSSHIISINNKEYTNRNFIFDKNICKPTDFMINDAIIGFCRDGVYVLNNDSTIMSIEAEEKNYFDSVSSKKMGTLERFRKSFRYPRPVLNVLTLRASFNVADFDTVSLKNSSIHYAEGFYNTMSMSNSGMYNKSVFRSLQRQELIMEFRSKLCLEFTSFIKNQFLRNLKIKSRTDTDSKKIISIIKSLELKCLKESNEYRKRKGTISSGGFFDNLFADNRRITEKSTFVYLITNLMGIPDPIKAVIQFFGLPAIVHGHTFEKQYTNLRYISYFVRCSLSNSCGNVIDVSKDYVSYPFLIGNAIGFNEYRMYFNTRIAMFSDIIL